MSWSDCAGNDATHPCVKTSINSNNSKLVFNHPLDCVGNDATHPCVGNSINSFDAKEYPHIMPGVPFFNASNEIPNYPPMNYNAPIFPPFSAGTDCPGHLCSVFEFNSDYVF